MRVRSIVLAPSMPIRDAIESVRQTQVHGDSMVESRRSGSIASGEPANRRQASGMARIESAASRSRSFRVYFRPPWMIP